MLSILGYWIFLLMVFLGMGLLVRRLLGFPTQTYFVHLSSFWVGWAFCILILQAWHLFYKINSVVLGLFVLLGFIGWFANSKTLVASLKIASKWILFLYAGLFLVIGVWLASLCTDALVPYDTGLYHIQAIKWNSEYAIIPGLGNLHHRLAFNNTNLLFSAAIDIGPFENKSNHVANGLLMFVLVMQIAIQLIACIRKKTRNHYNLYFSLMIGSAISWAYGFPAKYQLTGFNQDLPVFVIGIIVLGLLLKFLVIDKTKPEKIDSLFQILFIGCCGVSVKLSFLPVVILSAIVAMAYLIKEKSIELGSLIKLSILPTMLIGLWLGRNIILSGYLLFPLPSLHVPVAWKMPQSRVERTQSGIVNWARNPNSQDEDDKSVENWFPFWYTKLDGTIKITVILSLVQILISALISRLWKNSLNPRLISWLMVPILSILFWFFSAPNLRFSGAYFPGLFAGSIILVYDQLENKFASVMSHLYVSFGIMLVILIALQERNQSILPLIRIQMDPPIKRMTEGYNQYNTSIVDGITVNLPIDSHQCWISPLPCMPQENPKLHLIRPPEMSYGFWTEQ